AFETEKVIDEGVAGNRERNVTAPPPASVRVALSALDHSMPTRPTSRTVPDSSNAELVVVLIGSVQVLVQLVNAAAKLSSCRNSISERENRKPPENQLVESRTHCDPSQEALSVNQMDVVSAWTRRRPAAPPTPIASQSSGLVPAGLGWRLVLWRLAVVVLAA